MGNGDPKYLRGDGQFSIGGNDSQKFADNYARIFGHEEPKKAKKRKVRRKHNISPLIKMRRITT